MNSTDNYNVTYGTVQTDWSSSDTKLTVIITLSIVGIFISIYFMSNMILWVKKWNRSRRLKKVSSDSSYKIRCDGLIMHASDTRGVITDDEDEMDSNDWRRIKHLHLGEEGGFIRTIDRCTKKYPCCNDPVQIYLYKDNKNGNNGDLS